MLLKHIYGLSDEGVCERWVYDPYFQYFTGEEFFQHEFPHERSDLSHWRKRLGDKLELLLAESLRVAHKSGALRSKDLERVTVWKLYSFHAPETECIGKGKASAPYESGVNVSIVTTSARAPGHEGNPEQMEQPGRCPATRTTGIPCVTSLRTPKNESLTPDTETHAAAIVGEKNLDIVLPGRQHLDIDGSSLTVGKRVRDRIEEEVG